MKISYLMPTYDWPGRQRYIDRAISSALSQDFQNLEIIVAEEIGSHPVRLIADSRIVHIQQKGPRCTTVALNAAMDWATGDAFCFFSDDDQIAPGALARVAAALETAQWCYGRCGFDPPNEPDYGVPWDYEHLLNGNFIPCLTCYWRREAAAVVGRFDESVDLAGDYDYWLRLGARFTPAYIPEVLGIYTRRAGAVASTRQHGVAAHAALARQRARQHLLSK